MISAGPSAVRRVIPFMMASSGRCGVDSSLNISILPSRIMMKSVNVPPVSTPILEVDLRDILDESRNDGFDCLDRSLRVALPCERLNVGAHGIEPMDGDFAHPGKVFIRGSVSGDIFDPLHDLPAFFVIGSNLKGRPLAGVDSQFYILPPAGLDHSQIEHCRQNVNGRKITA